MHAILILQTHFWRYSQFIVILPNPIPWAEQHLLPDTI